MRRLPFLVATNHRSGFHLLASLLNSTKRVGKVSELTGRESINKDLSKDEVDAYFDSVHEITTHTRSAVGHWGVKACFEWLAIIERYMEINEIMPSHIKWIWLRRRDKAKQALSFIRASRSGVWSLLSEDSPDIFEKNRGEIDIDLATLQFQTLCYYIREDTWQNFFEQNQITPHTLYYEDFADELTWESTVQGIFDFLGVPYELPLNVSTHNLKQNCETFQIYKAFLAGVESQTIPLNYTYFDEKILL